MGDKICNICGVEKPVSEFEQQKSRPNPRKTCKLCRAKKQWNNIQSDPVRHRAYLDKRKEWRLDNREMVNTSLRVRNYEITENEYYNMLEDQMWLCGLCDAELNGDRFTHIDHDHKTGKVRAILCGKCNSGLGYFADDPAVMIRAAKYIERHRVEL